MRRKVEPTTSRNCLAGPTIGKDFRFCIHRTRWFGHKKVSPVNQSGQQVGRAVEVWSGVQQVAGAGGVLLLLYTSLRTSNPQTALSCAICCKFFSVTALAITAGSDGTDSSQHSSDPLTDVRSFPQVYGEWRYEKGHASHPHTSRNPTWLLS